MSRWCGIARAGRRAIIERGGFVVWAGRFTLVVHWGPFRRGYRVHQVLSRGGQRRRVHWFVLPLWPFLISIRNGVV